MQKHELTLYLISWTEGLLHGMQTISHGIDGIDDKAHLGVLCILIAQRLPPCEEYTPVQSQHLSFTCRREELPIGGTNRCRCGCMRCSPAGDPSVCTGSDVARIQGTKGSSRWSRASASGSSDRTRSRRPTLTLW